MAVIRSMYANIPAHEVATVFMNTGSLRIAKPSMGAWTIYGLGTENQNLPGFICPPHRRPSAWRRRQLLARRSCPRSIKAAHQHAARASVQQMIQNIQNQYVCPSPSSGGRSILCHQLDQIQSKNLQHESAAAGDAAGILRDRVPDAGISHRRVRRDQGIRGHPRRLRQHGSSPSGWGGTGRQAAVRPPPRRARAFVFIAGLA